jgi:hypothetical protein
VDGGVSSLRVALFKTDQEQPLDEPQSPHT